MPRIVKGGKYVFGWSKVSDDGEIRIPDEAVTEYNLQDKVYLFPGSKTSGGFGITTPELLKNSPFERTVKNSELDNFSQPEGIPVVINRKSWCWVNFDDKKNKIKIPSIAFKVFNVNPYFLDHASVLYK